MVSITLLQLTSILFALAVFRFPFILFPFFLVSLEYCTLQSLEHFSFNSVRWGSSWYFRKSSRGGLSNFTPIAGMCHLISEPKFKIHTPPSPLLISDKSLRHHFTTTTRILQGFAFLCKLRPLSLRLQNLNMKGKNEKDSGRSSKMTPSCKWPIQPIGGDIVTS